MRHRTKRSPTPEENRRRNLERIWNPPKPTLADRIMCALYGVEEWWQRHVSQRELTRMLDNARLVSPWDRDPQPGLDRLLDEYPGDFPDRP